jgi:ubiquinone/menaquinone biosynthesis C-methylase UbiE
VSGVYDLNISTRDYHNKKRWKLDVRNLVVGDAMDIPTADNIFDVVFSSNTFEHLSEPWVVAEECVRVVKKGGILVHFAPFSWPHHDKPDYYRYSSEGFAYLFERTGKVKTIKSETKKYDKPGKAAKNWKYWRTTYYGVKKQN